MPKQGPFWDVRTVVYGTLSIATAQGTGTPRRRSRPPSPKNNRIVTRANKAIIETPRPGAVAATLLPSVALPCGRVQDLELQASALRARRDPSRLDLGLWRLWRGLSIFLFPELTITQISTPAASCRYLKRTASKILTFACAPAGFVCPCRA